MNPLLDDVIGDLLAEGPTTIEAAHQRLIELDESLAARGQPWLLGALRRHPQVRLLSGKRFELREDTAFELEIAEPEALGGPPQETAPETVTETVAAARGSFVVVDLETNPDRAAVADHEIIEIGACSIENGEVVERFARLVAPTRPLMPEITKLTGLTADELANGLPPEEALNDLRTFCGELPVVAHNGFGYDFVVLDGLAARLGVEALANERLDTLELAHVVFPRTGYDILPGLDGSVPPSRRSVDDLAEHFGLQEAQRDVHRALEDAELTAAILKELIAELQGEDGPRPLQRWLLHAGESSWSRFVDRPVSRPNLVDLLIEPPTAPFDPPPEDDGFDLSEAVAPVAEGGAFVVDGRGEYRPQQEEMARLVARALHAGQRVAVEAPTGTGKTLAYLTPGVAWAKAVQEPVVVATHSKVLQSQLLSAIKDYSESVGPIDWVLLKGTENYVSLENLDSALEAGPADQLEALALAVIAGWACVTPTGDWDDLNAWQLEDRLPGFSALCWTLSVDTEPSTPRSRLEELCFHRRAAEHLEVADIGILNHAVLVSRTSIRDMVESVVVDEAHNLEEAATNALSSSLDEHDLKRLLRAIHDPDKRWGTLGRYMRATGSAKDDDHVERVRAALERTSHAIDSLGPQIVEYIRSRTPAKISEVEQYGVSYRVRQGMDTDRAGYREVTGGVRSLCGALVELADALQELPVPEQLRGRYRRHRLEAELARMGRTARTHVQTLKHAVAKTPSDADQEEPDDDTYISLLDLQRVDARWSWGVRRVPVDVSAELGELWDSMRSVVLTSATLQVNGSFSHLIDRLGLGYVESLSLETPFTELSDNEIVVIPDHLPAPRGGLMDEFTYAEADELARLFLLTHGRAMGLFTARSRMLFVKDHVRERLDPLQLTVLCQGDAPSAVLSDRMRNEPATSLLATRSFWEGIDVPGEALSLLAIEKLPFSSPGDPIVAARMDHLEMKGRDPFSDYLVPEAVLRFVQGVGRLIRRPTDRGAVVVLDKRLRKPLPYRDAFRGSLPGSPRFLHPLSAHEGYEAIASHLDIDLNDDLLEALFSLPSSDPWGDIEELQLSDEEITDPDAVEARLEQVRDRLGFSSWRPGQLEVMRRFLMGEDVLAVLPTGTGKSLTFQIPALLRPGLTLVVSPLVALMRDQVESLRERGMTKIATITSGQSQSEQEEILARARGGHYKLLYVSPERLWTQKFKSGLADVEIARIAIDEAHCIAQWGHTFRPEYLGIPAAIDAITEGSRPPMLAATATATPEVQKEITSQLGLKLNDGVISRDPDRPELHYYVHTCENADDRNLQTVRIVDAFRGQPAIVYVPSQAKATQLAMLLRSDNHVARAYHGGMDQAERLLVEESFREGELDVVVGTNAFGLGIDKPDIALILHHEMSASVEQYVQETGRGARGAIDGRGPSSAACVLLKTPRDCWIHKKFVESAAPDREDLMKVWEVVSKRELHLPLDEIAQSAAVDENDRVAVALHHLEQHGLLERLHDVTWQGRVWVPADATQLFEAAQKSGASFPTHTRRVLKEAVDRGSGDFHLMSWSERLDLAPDRLEEILLELQRRDVLGFSGWRSAVHLIPKTGARPDFVAIERACESRRNAVRDLSEKAKRYRDNRNQCRRAFLLTYLGADAPTRCDGCDVCRPDLPQPWRSSDITLDQLERAVPAAATILALIDDVRGADYSRSNLAACLAGSEGDYALPERLAEHHLHSSLKTVGFKGVQNEIDRLIAGDRLEELAVEYSDRTYNTIRRPKKEDD